MEHIYQNIQGMFTFPNLYKSMVDFFQGENIHFVEVGTWKGRSATFMAVEIINSKKNIKFDCVDTWTLSKDEVELWSKGLLFDGNIEQIEIKGIEDYDDDLFKLFVKNISPVNDIINPIRMSSEEASFLYDDKSLDFIFIDANHEYEFVKKDLVCWMPKLKTKGIIAGHDYFESNAGVKQAVDEFFESFIGEDGNKKELRFSEGCWIYA